MIKTTDEPNCRSCGLSVKTIFKKLTPEQLDTIYELKTCFTYKKGETIYEEGNRINGIYCIHQGTIKIYKTGLEGKEQIIMFGRSGDIFGYRSVINNEPACTSVKVIDEVCLCFIPTDTLYHLLRENSEFGIELLQIACKELDESNNYITDIAQKSVRERLAEVLLSLESKFGVNDENIINVSLTREELANLIGTATESVIRLLSEFKNDGLIEIQGRKIKIKDIARIKKISNLF